MFCNRCGNPIKDGNRFCSQCGSPAPVEPISPYVPPVKPTEVPAHDKPPVTPVKPTIPENNSNDTFLFSAPDLDMGMGTPAPKVAVEPIAEPVVQPAVEEPVYTEPVVQPVVEEPVYTEPFVQPVVEEPVYTEPVEQPVVEEPMYAEPTYEENVYEEAIPPVESVTYNQPPTSYESLDKKVDKSKKTSIAIKIISVFLCIFMFATVIGSAVTLTGRNLVSNDSVMEIADTLDVETIAEECEIKNDLFNNIDPEDLQEIYDGDSEFKPFVKKVLLSYSNYLTDDGKIKKITVEDYNNVIRKSAGVIYDISGSDIDYTVSKGEFEFENPEESDLEPIKIMVSWLVIIGMIALTVIFALLLFILRKFKLTALLWNGITISVAGLCYTIASFVLPMFMEDVKIAQILYEDYVQSKILMGGIIVLGIGLLFVIGFVVSKLILRKKNK